MRRLDHRRAAGRDGRRELAGRHGEREVPRGDGVHRADRLQHGEHPLARARGDREPALDPHRLLGEPAQELGAVRHLAVRLGQRLAHFQGHAGGEEVAAFEDQVERTPQHLGAFPWRGGGPGLGGRAGRVEGGDRILRGAVGDAVEDLLGGGVHHVEGDIGRTPSPADELPVRKGGEHCVGELRGIDGHGASS
ncbi:hypothetical protein SDC9_160522 [bioreactor metagenome]|uniref:Uncharacterized protein n=1 Tax=bioreactor metagenome TaxID=1076179 RepID=A0A645FI52_9ZZZZ